MSIDINPGSPIEAVAGHLWTSISEYLRRELPAAVSGWQRSGQQSTRAA